MSAELMTIAPPPPDFAQRELTATVQSFRVPRRAGADESSWTIVDLTSGQCATGEFDDGELTVGVTYRFFGQWIQHAKYGPQFVIETAVPVPTATEAGTVAYLTRGGVGLSRAEAQRLWRTYGADAVGRLRDVPVDVAAECRIDEDKARSAARVLKDTEQFGPATIELFGLFAGRSFPRGAVKACIAKWGIAAPRIVRHDPFTLLVNEIKGVGFKRADSLYLDLGGNPQRLKRSMFCGWAWARETSDGDTWCLKRTLETAILRGIGVCDASRAIELGVRGKWFARRVDATGATWIAERENASNEEKIARHVKRIATHKPLWSAELDESLSDHQRETLQAILCSPLAILAGTPGTGKTYSAAALVRGLLRRPGRQRPRIIVAAPTGKAAVRITEALRRYSLPLEAHTLHLTLGVLGYSSGKANFARGELNPLDCDLLIIDEGSMVDTDLMAATLAAIPQGGNVLICGDPFQLPPVGHGAPLRDLIAANIPTALLAEIQRNAGRIVEACRDVKDGVMFAPAERIDVDAGLNLIHVATMTPEAQSAQVIELLGALSARGYDPMWEVQILVARNDGEHVGRRAFNFALQAHLNAETEPDEGRRNIRFRKRDKVICLKNTTATLHELRINATPQDVSAYAPSSQQVYVANGDIGAVVATDKSCAVVRFFSQPFDRIVKVYTDKKRKREDDAADEKQADFDLAYAITTHKSQGSQWPVVIVVLDEMGGRVTCREHLYTSISRAEKLCVLVGKLPVAMRMVQKVELARRKTFLTSLLQEA
jgi:exodeoxyribonuclease V alpha subunit